MVLGTFDKACLVAGVERRVRGLVLAAGGHYERMGCRPDYFRDRGHVNMFDAALCELQEEIGIGEDGIVASQYIGCMDDCLNDPRKHVIRHILLRWVDAGPSSSEELENLVCVPLSKIDDLLCGRFRVRLDGENLGLVLNHDYVIHTVMALDATKQFIAACRSSSA